MPLLGIDLGATKLALALFNETGKILYKESIPLENRKGREVGELIAECFTRLTDSANYGEINSIGISVSWYLSYYSRNRLGAQYSRMG